MKKGGFREGSGRKSKATEIELIELLSPLDAKAFEAIAKGVKSGEFSYIKLFMEYRYGKPKQQIEIDTEFENKGITIVMGNQETKELFDKT